MTDIAVKPRFLDLIRRSAIVRFIVQAVVLVGVYALSSMAIDQVMPPVSSPLRLPLAMVRDLVQAGLILGAYALLMRWMEKRPASELDPRVGAVGFPIGLLVGVGMMTGVYAVLTGLGMAAFHPGTGPETVALGAVFALTTGVFEELLFRGVAFRIIEQACGTTVAVIASAAIFGLLHSFNPGATAFSDVAIALEAGAMLALAYAVTRNLWLAIGLHAAWNFTEGNVFGAQVSGDAPMPSLIHSTLTGPVLLTGGGFGPEASVITIVFGLLVAGVFAAIVIRKRDWRPMKFRQTLA